MGINTLILVGLIWPMGINGLIPIDHDWPMGISWLMGINYRFPSATFGRWELLGPWELTVDSRQLWLDQ
jgi:hypothetical protein